MQNVGNDLADRNDAVVSINKLYSIFFHNFNNFSKKKTRIFRE